MRKIGYSAMGRLTGTVLIGTVSVVTVDLVDDTLKRSVPP